MPKYVVRYGVMRHLGVFSSRGRDRYARGHRVIARTGRGQEAGEVLCEATEHVLSQMEDPRTGQILRQVTQDDDVEIGHIADQATRDRQVCQQRIDELQLAMKIVDLERVYGGERVVVYYLADDRVDFRELVKHLAKDLQTRVEMRHIGVRDEAKLLADYGDCGKPVCCNTHLSEMPPVSMKMAKLQKATLDPTKISGRCGRLKCCLRYEYDTYQEMKRELPPVGRDVVTRDGRARVLSQEILTSELLVEMEEGRRLVINASDVLSVMPKTDRAGSGKPKRPKPSKSPATGDATSGAQPEGDAVSKKPDSNREKSADDSRQESRQGEDTPAEGKPSKRRRRPRRGSRRKGNDSGSVDGDRSARNDSDRPPGSQDGNGQKDSGDKPTPPPNTD